MFWEMILKLDMEFSLRTCWMLRIKTLTGANVPVFFCDFVIQSVKQTGISK